MRKSGAWFSYGEERLGQGRENVRMFLKENDELRLRIEREVFEKAGIATKPAADDAASNGAAQLDGPPEPAAETPKGKKAARAGA